MVEPETQPEAVPPRVEPTRDNVQRLLRLAQLIRDRKAVIESMVLDPDSWRQYALQDEFFAQHDLVIAAALQTLAESFQSDLDHESRGVSGLAMLRHELRTQDNAATAHPVYTVQQKRRIYGLTDEYADGFVWLNEDGEVGDEDLVELLEETSGEVPDGLRRVGYKDVYEHVTSFFSAKEARRFIMRNSHNLSEPRLWIASAHNNYEWRQVVAYLLGT